MISATANAAKDSWESIQTVWGRVEATIGLVAVFALTFGPTAVFGVAFLIAALLGELQVAIVTGVGVLVCGPMAFWLSDLCDQSLQEYVGTMGRHEPDTKRPFAVIVAEKLPNLPAFIRLPLAFWWLMHFMGGSILCWLAKSQLLWQANGYVCFGLGFVFHFAANLFLVLAIATWTESTEATSRTWSWRIAIDGVAAALLVVC